MRSRHPLILGLMRMNEVRVDELEDLLFLALELGIDAIDVADVYSRGRAEEVLGQVFALHPGLREKFFLQSKVGIVNKPDRPCYYDFSGSYLVEAVHDSLRRLGLPSLDALLLHRPDIFMDREDVLAALRTLREEGAVSSFGVSNMDREQIEYLEGEGIGFESDQLQLGLGHLDLLSSTFQVDLDKRGSNHADGLYFYLKRRRMFLQCWSPFQVGLFGGSLFRHPSMEECRTVLKELARKYRCYEAAIALSFLLSLGETVEVIVGGLNREYLKTAAQAKDVVLEKEDWYHLYVSTGNVLP